MSQLVPVRVYLQFVGKHDKSGRCERTMYFSRIPVENENVYIHIDDELEVLTVRQPGHVPRFSLDEDEDREGFESDEMGFVHVSVGLHWMTLDKIKDVLKSEGWTFKD